MARKSEAEPLLYGMGFVIAAVVVVCAAGAYVDTFGKTSSTKPLTGYARVIDGDTIVIGGRHIRLAAIDAPEQDQTCRNRAGQLYECGTVATLHLEAQIAGREVSCTQTDTDKYGRAVAYCSVGTLDLGEFMVRAGMAIDYLRYDRGGRYLAAEQDAREAARGIWQGPFMEPEKWRHRR